MVAAGCNAARTATLQTDCQAVRWALDWIRNELSDAIVDRRTNFFWDLRLLAVRALVDVAKWKHSISRVSCTDTNCTTAEGDIVLGYVAFPYWRDINVCNVGYFTLGLGNRGRTGVLLHEHMHLVPNITDGNPSTYWVPPTAGNPVFNNGVPTNRGLRGWEWIADTYRYWWQCRNLCLPGHDALPCTRQGCSNWTEW